MDHELPPAAHLAIAHGARERMAARAGTPAWYPPLYGLGCGMILASLALPPALTVAGALAGMLLLAGIYTVWTRTSGLSVSGYRRGRTIWITAAVLVAFALIGGGAAWLRFDRGVIWAPVPAGLLVAVIAGSASAAWDRAWRADILAGA